MAPVRRVLPGGVADLASKHKFVIVFVTDDPDSRFSDVVYEVTSAAGMAVGFATILKQDIEANAFAADMVRAELRDQLGYRPWFLPTGYYLTQDWSLLTFHAEAVPSQTSAVLQTIGVAGLGVTLLATLVGDRRTAAGAATVTVGALQLAIDANTAQALLNAMAHRIRAEAADTERKEREAGEQMARAVVAGVERAYKLLGMVGPLSTKGIGEAYKQKVKLVHPDLHSGDPDPARWEDETRRLTEARDLLLKFFELIQGAEHGG